MTATKTMLAPIGLDGSERLTIGSVYWAPVNNASDRLFRVRLLSMTETSGCSVRVLTGQDTPACGFVLCCAPSLLLEFEEVALADGVAHQRVIPGVAMVSVAARQVAQEGRRRESRRGHAALPSGGLWDDVAHAQTDLF